MRWTIGTVAALAVSACALCPVARAATFGAPIVPPTIDPGCDYASRDCEYGSYHSGIDYLGDDPTHEPVLATADGIVAVAATTAQSHGFGNAVILRHTLPRGRNVYSLYGHMKAPPQVRVGECVDAGTSLGTQGDSGDTTDVSTHFEIKTEPKFGPPYGYSPGTPGDYGYFDPRSFIGKREALGVCKPSVRWPCGRRAAVRVDTPRVSAAAGYLAAGRIRSASGCRVQLSLRRRAGTSCRWWRGFRDRMRPGACAKPVWVRVRRLRDGGWSYRFRRALHAGHYTLRVRLLRGPRVVKRANTPLRLHRR